ncbi:acetoin dehydrogenase E2 subunit dihydrolipoyllysine-residue acetyltransferase [Anaerotruncus sp. 2789STDY5834896]|uniref:Acetoin dehydrogenase E2 subunit dihydrolipoyllysine-residue acetyltransferase n=1 Tax=uncultured Anaerotruncus sp. TaxID=905011 RepID=A0A1C6GPH3_9FIRM|nr:acetoin dehydrogenase E2 subunit dihydrolipoyllysine-residue acetyltransferase [uncultured Anaerotruncus sp.]
MTATVWDTPVYYEELGKGTPVVALHGWTGSHLHMRESIEPVFNLLSHHRRIYPDLPGMGDTPRCERIKNTDDMLDFIIAFIDQVIGSDTPFFVIGHSYGGYLVRGLISKLRDRVLGGVLICPVSNPVHENRLLPKFTTGFTNYQFLESIPQQHREGFTKTMVIQNQYTFNRYLDEIVPAEEAYDADYLADILHRGYGYAVTPEERFGFCDTPTLFLLGKQDNVVGFAETLSLLSYYRKHSVLLLENAGHNLDIEHPNIFCEMVKSWLWELEVPQQNG